ncbi:hypothetical protein G7054_g7106 [Neopestalotiopsis clavispora]|nr:hypothetical protein G7054_g7106 [Neopestalotiopsis clavispora]
MSTLCGAQTDPAVPNHTEQLSLCNHVSPRSYIALVLCFPLADTFAQAAIDHLRISLQQVAKEQPLFTGQLRLVGDSRPGVAELVFCPDREIPFDVRISTDSASITYSDLKAKSFPQRFFIGPEFDQPAQIGSDPIPIVRVHVTILPGGLLLTIYLHHSIGDGHSVRNFLKCFAAKTKGEVVDTVYTQTMRKPWPYQRKATSFSSALSACREFTALPDLSGPWQVRMSRLGPPLPTIERSGKVFVFSDTHIAELQKLLSAQLQSSAKISTYTCIAALAFSHIIKARLQADSPSVYNEDESQALLWNTVGWRTRTAQPLPEEYFGNAVLLNATRVSTKEIYDACEDVAALGSLVCSIRKSIDEVDEEFVAKRLSLFAEIDDPRVLGFDLDPRVPTNLIFNSWRYFGADIEWNIPGVNVAVPESVRKAQGSWNLGTAILLPTSPTSGRQELFVSLTNSAMASLCADKEWLRWISQVIE